jgi:hypothetical protein
LQPQELVVVGLVREQGVEERETSALEVAPSRNQLLGLFQQGDLDVESQGSKPPVVGEEPKPQVHSLSVVSARPPKGGDSDAIQLETAARDLSLGTRGPGL